MPGYRVGRVGRREADIRQEIRTQGPVQATMDVYQVLLYKDLRFSFYPSPLPLPYLSLLKLTVKRHIQNSRHPSITCAVGYVRGSPGGWRSLLIT